MDEQSPGFPWPQASATGIGSMPGTDPAQACRISVGEMPDLPFLPELPERGPGADITGRAAALLIDMPAELTAGGWKLAERPGRDLSRAAGYWSHDLDTLEEVAAGYDGGLKIQLCGPWTLAATLQLTRSLNPVLADAGAVADLTASLAEGLAAHAADVRKRVPGAQLIVQLDEPALPAALAGRVPTASGLNVVPAIEESVAIQRLSEVLAAAPAATVVHCCGRAAPFPLIARAGASAVSFALSALPVAGPDQVAEIAEAGLGILAGALPTSSARQLAGGSRLTARQTAEAAVTLWRRTGLAAGQFTRQVVITPECGLAGMAPDAARAALAHCREAARIAPELIEPS